MNTYGAIWQGKELEIKANTTYEAQKLAVIEFQKVAGRKTVKGYEITVALLRLNDADYVHTAIN
jgi:hypothetical protein